MPTTRRVVPALESQGLTHLGLQRLQNNDFILRGDTKRLFIVADGVGLDEHGFIAAREASNKMHSLFNPALKNIANAMLGAHEHLKRVNETKRTSGGTVLQKRKDDDIISTTTLTALHIDQYGVARIAQAGDSRAYLFRNGRLTQLTQDQLNPFEPGALGQYVGAGELTPVVTRGTTKPNDVFLLCTDGLTKHANNQAISGVLQSYLSGRRTLKEATKQLIDEANNRGGSDNITALLVHVKPSTRRR